MKKVEYKTSNDDKWKIVYSNNESGSLPFIHHVTVYLKRKSKKWYQMTWKCINSASSWDEDPDEFVKIANMLILQHYDNIEKQKKLKEFYGVK